MYKILKKKWLTKEICYMDVEAKDLANGAKPGQFLIVKTDEKGERIPLTICDYDREVGSVAIVFQVVGEGTKKMASYNEGEYFQDVVGPLGQPSEFLHIPLEELKIKKYLFVAGGVGTAPIYPQVKWFKENGIEADVIVGARSKDILILEEEMKEVANNLYICTDDGSYGIHGRVTDVIDRLIKEENKKYDHAIVIGPMIMMKFASMKCREYNLPNTVSLNPLMVDGTGMCGACRVTIDGKVKFACVDGPEFDGDKVDYDEAMRRQMMYKTTEGRNILEIEDGETHHNDSCPMHSDLSEIKGRVPVREQDPDKRNKNFYEVCYGYNLEEAQKEAEQQRDSQTEREMQRGKERQNGKENEQQRNSKVYFSEENDRDTFENSSGNNKKGRTNNRNSDRNHNSTNSNGTVKEDRNCKVVTIHQNEKSALAEHEEKMQQFEEIMGRIVGKALREQAENLGDAMGNHLCNKMLREVDELMVEQEQREEERYKKLDEAIRSTQKARQEIAVSKDGIFKKKSRFFRKNKRKGI